MEAARGGHLSRRRLQRHDAGSPALDALREAAVWVAASFGVGIDDLTVPNDRPIREVAVDPT
jgi:hypothetical protein